MKKRVFKVCALCAIVAASFYAGWKWNDTEIYKSLDNSYFVMSKTDMLNGERKYCASTLRLLHWFYENDKDYWRNVVMDTEEYKLVEDANCGDWEDFYCDW